MLVLSRKTGEAIVIDKDITVTVLEVIGNKVDIKVVDGKVQYLPGKDPNDVNYKVGGIPQIMLIDKKGNIRLIMVGYDDANEAKLAAIIESLLKEK